MSASVVRLVSDVYKGCTAESCKSLAEYDIITAGLTYCQADAYYHQAVMLKRGLQSSRACESLLGVMLLCLGSLPNSMSTY